MTFHDVLAFASAHWFGAAVFLVGLLPSVIVGLSDHPEARSVLNILLQILSVLTHKDSPGTFKFPLTLSPPPASDLTELKPRGFARLPVLLALAVMVLALGAIAAPKPEALKDAVVSDPGAVQPGADVPPPPSPQFGGCIRGGKICFAPAVAVTLAAINLKTKTIEGAFSPGIGYGLTVNPGKWSSFGADLYFTMDPAAQRASAALLLKFFNGYVRAGASKGVIGDVSWRIPVAFGLGF